jgi:hypothetical protein
LNVLAGTNRWCLAEQGNQLSLSTNLQTENAKPVVRIMKGDPLHQSPERLSLMRPMINWSHADRFPEPSPKRDSGPLLINWFYRR